MSNLIIPGDPSIQVVKANETGIFTNYVFKAIPLAFDESMSYYETLCALLSYLKDTVIPTVNNNADAVAELQNLYIELKNYVDNYFDSQDFQQMVNNKLDEMVEDGTLENLINQHILDKRLRYYKVDNTISHADLQTIFNDTNAKIISFETGNYIFEDPFYLNSNTKILLNGSVLKITSLHGFYNFLPTDEILSYNGNSNISFENGILEGFAIAFCHGTNINFKNIHFLKSSSNHFLELAALNGVKIENCKFEGQTLPTYKECIQIDDMKYANMPYFDSSENISYDLTHCKNFLIDGCEFINGSDESYSLGTAIGMHTYTTDGLHHENITITNNKVTDPAYAAFRINNTYNATIANNTVNCTTANSNYGIRFGYYVENIIVKNNIFNGILYRVLYCSTNPYLYKNVTFDNNVISNALNASTHGNKALFILNNPLNFNFVNNTISNNDRVIFYLNGTDIDIDDEEQETFYGTVIFNNNTFKSATSTKACIQVYNIDEINITDNKFEYDTTPSGSVVVFYDEDVIPVIANNVFNTTLLPNRTINLNVNKNAENVYNLYCSVYSGNVQNFTSVTPTLNLSKFNSLLVIVGGTTNTQTFVLKGYAPRSKLTARTYKIPVVDNSDESQLIKLTINDDGTLTETNSGSDTFVRTIFGYNSLEI